MQLRTLMWQISQTEEACVTKERMHVSGTTWRWVSTWSMGWVFTWSICITPWAGGGPPRHRKTCIAVRCLASASCRGAGSKLACDHDVLGHEEGAAPKGPARSLPHRTPSVAQEHRGSARPARCRRPAPPCAVEPAPTDQTWE